MGIMIQNTTSHTTIAIVLTYVPAPTPSLFYRSVLVLPAGTRTDSPTWQCPGVIYAFEPPQGVPAEAVAQQIRVAMARFNVVRAGFSFFGGQLLDLLDLFGGLFDYVVEIILETVLESVMEAALANNAWDEVISNAFNQYDAKAVPYMPIEFVRHMYLLGGGGLFLRNQYSATRIDGALAIEYDGLAWGK